MDVKEKDEVFEELTRLFKKSQENKKVMTLLESSPRRQSPRPPYRSWVQSLAHQISMKKAQDKQEMERKIYSNIEYFFRLWPLSNRKRLGKALRKYPIIMTYFPKDRRE